MKADVLLGLQWGDEGKGKIVDVLTPDYDVIARFQGGPNAGHTLVFDGQAHVLHTIPSGIFHEDKLNIVGNGVVIDPVILKEELRQLHEKGVDTKKSLHISKKAHLILPTHRLLDAASEAEKGKGKIGSTLKGIGPTYMDKTGRNGLRVGDVVESDFKAKYKELVRKHKRLLSLYDHQNSLAELEKDWFASLDCFQEVGVMNSEYELNEFLDNDRRILAEGAQGALLDIDFGSYPFVTSSSTTASGACSGLGIPPNKIGEVTGIFKAYCTRVGSGPFPTELHDNEGQRIRDLGNEYGATTGRPRRCGWLDLPALKYSIMVNGVTRLAMTKADVLGGFERIRVCTHYRINGELTTEVPYDLSDERIEPVYKDIPGWQTDLNGVKDLAEFPQELHAFIELLEEELQVPVSIVSVGPERGQTLHRPIPKVL